MLLEVKSHALEQGRATIFVCGPNSSQIYIFKAQNGASAGRMWPAGRMLPPPPQAQSKIRLLSF